MSLSIILFYYKHLPFLTVDLLIDTTQSATSTSSQPISDLELIERAILNVTEMLDRVLAYVRDVLSGQKKGDPAIGRYLMDALGTNTEGFEKAGFNSSLQVTSFYSIARSSFVCSYFTSLGYINVNLLGEPFKITSRSIISTCSCSCRIEIATVFLSVASLKIQFLGNALLAVKNSRVLQIMSTRQNFAQRPCVCRTDRDLVKAMFRIVKDSSA